MNQFTQVILAAVIVYLKKVKTIIEQEGRIATIDEVIIRLTKYIDDRNI